MEYLSLVALALSAVALVLVVRAGRTTGSPGGSVESVPEDVHGLRQEVAALRREGRDALRHLAVVRYDAFDDMGGQLSWSVALLDDAGDGVVITSIHGRSDSRTYAKSIGGWTSEQQLSPEELDAIQHARPS